MGDQGIVRSGRHRGLMHVQRAGEPGADAAEIEIAVVPPDRWVLLLHQLHQLRFTAADGGEVDHRAEAPGCVQSIALISGTKKEGFPGPPVNRRIPLTGVFTVLPSEPVRAVSVVTYPELIGSGDQLRFHSPAIGAF